MSSTGNDDSAQPEAGPSGHSNPACERGKCCPWRRCFGGPCFRGFGWRRHWRALLADKKGAVAPLSDDEKQQLKDNLFRYVLSPRRCGPGKCLRRMWALRRFGFRGVGGPCGFGGFGRFGRWAGAWTRFGPWGGFPCAPWGGACPRFGPWGGFRRCAPWGGACSRFGPWGGFRRCAPWAGACSRFGPWGGFRRAYFGFGGGPGRCGPWGGFGCRFPAFAPWQRFAFPYGFAPHCYGAAPWWGYQTPYGCPGYGWGAPQYSWGGPPCFKRCCGHGKKAPSSE
jgi:hypothetical protein